MGNFMVCICDISVVWRDIWQEWWEEMLMGNFNGIRGDRGYMFNLKNERSAWIHIITTERITIPILWDKTRCGLADICQCCGRIRCFQFHSQTGIWKQQSLSCGAWLTLNIQRGVLWGPQRVIFCDPAVTISTNLLLIFVRVPHQLKINIM